MKTKIRIFIMIQLGFASLAGLAIGQSHIILCMSDDQGWGDVGYNGHPYLKTSHLDRMAAEGVTFSRFYAAAAMCSPTRGSCLTGRNPYRFGITFAMKGMLEATEIPIMMVLKQDGYTTGHFGKWHVGTLSKAVGDQKRWGAFSEDPARYYCSPWERDVDECFVTESKVPTWDPMVDPGDPSKPYENEYFKGDAIIEIQSLKGDDSRVIMDRAVLFMQSAIESKTPFFEVVLFYTPHAPVIRGEKYRALYSDRPEAEQHDGASIIAMDEQIGRLRAELETLGIAECIFFRGSSSKEQYAEIEYTIDDGLNNRFTTRTVG